MTWRRVDPFFARRVQLAMFLTAIWFGLDYFFTPEGSSDLLTVVERGAVPLWVWGAVITAAGVAGFIVEWRILGDDHPLVMTDKRCRWGWVTNIAHIALFATFLALAGSVLVEVLHRGMMDGYWFGWRTPAMWLLFAYVNSQYIRRLGQIWQPLP